MIGRESTTRGLLEPRRAMMAVVKATWEDQDETVHTAPARIEDTSPSGACFRLKVPIEPETRVDVRSCRDGFSEMTKWCREDHGEYLVAMRRDRLASRGVARIVPKMQAPSVRQVDIPDVRQADAPRVRPVDRPIVRELERPSLHETEPEEQEEVQEEVQEELQEMEMRSAPLPVPPVFQS